MIPGPAACARAARGLSSADRVLLCRGAWSAAPADCFTAAPFTMEKGLKISLCRGAPLDASPGRCATVVRSVMARAAALLHPHPQLSASVLDDPLAVELCFGSRSLAPAQCFDAAPDFLVEISSTTTAGGNTTMAASLSLRAALCTDADDEGPAQCANGAANYTPAVLSPATVVSLCHGKRPLGPPPPPPTAAAATPPVLHGSVACALAAEGGVGLPRRLHLDGEPSARRAPVNLLRLCSGASGPGPAQCVAKAPSKLSVDQKVELCREDPSTGGGGGGGGSGSGSAGDGSGGPPDPTLPAVCAFLAFRVCPARSHFLLSNGSNGSKHNRFSRPSRRAHGQRRKL